MTRSLRTLPALALTGLVAAACGASPRECPLSAALVEAAAMTELRPGGGMDLTDVVFEARITGVELSCDIDDDDREVEAGVTVTFEVDRGPAAQNITYTLPYFVVVTAPDGTIVSKRNFVAQFAFAGRARVTVENAVPDTKFKMKPNERAYAYDVLAGFQLTKEQLEYNRLKRRYGP